MPGRIAGETVDRRGRRCWVLTLQTARAASSAARRPRATLAPTRGLRRAASHGLPGRCQARNGHARSARSHAYTKSHHAAHRTRRTRWTAAAVQPWPFFKEFVARSTVGGASTERLSRALENCWLFCSAAAGGCRWVSWNWPTRCWSPSRRNDHAAKSTGSLPRWPGRETRSARVRAIGRPLPSTTGTTARKLFGSTCETLVRPSRFSSFPKRPAKSARFPASPTCRWPQSTR